MTEVSAVFLLVKVTLVFAVVLIAMRRLHETSPAVRHLLCAAAFGISLLLLLPAFENTAAISLPIVVVPTGAAQTAGTLPALPLWKGIEIVWCIGTLLLLARLAAGYWQVSQIVRRAQHGGNAGDLEIRHCHIAVPLAAGVLRPVILLPFEADDWPEEVRRAAVEHERTHILRRDNWVNLLANIVCALYWFHPLAWLLRRRLHDEQESACDDATIESGFTPAAYGEALLAVARQLPSQLPLFQLMANPMTCQKTLYARISRLAEWQSGRPLSPVSRMRFTFTGIALLTALALLGPAAAQQKVYKIGNGVSAPRVVDRTEPSHPAGSQAQKISGTVRLSMVIGADGRAHDLKVVKSLDSELDVNAARAIEQWKFEPAQLRGQPVPVHAIINVYFRSDRDRDSRTGDSR